MLYRGSEVMREVAWVIFDEIHYMRDKGTGTTRRSNPAAERALQHPRHRRVLQACVTESVFT